MADNDHFFMTVSNTGRTAVVMMMQDPASGWKLRADRNLWPRNAATGGQWRGQGWGEWTDYKHCLGGGGKELFRVGDVNWPPDIEDNARFLYKPFMPGELWLELDPNTAPVRRPSAQSVWRPVITGPLLTAVAARFQEIQDEIVQTGVQAGLDVMSVLDPTGALAVASASYAARHGDYFGCATALLGVIPVVGKACEVARVAQANGRLAQLVVRLTKLKTLVMESAVSAKEARIGGQIIREEVQGAVKLAGGARPARAAGALGHIASAGHAVTEGADLARVAEKGGMTLRDAQTMQTFSRQNESIAVVRQTAKESLARHGDVLNTGKPCELAPFHTAHDDSRWSGLIVVRDNQLAEKTIVDAHGVRRLKGMEQYVVSDLRCEKTGDRLITKDGIGYYSDYDFMGMYHGSGRPYLDFKELNDNAGIVSFMNRLLSGQGLKVNHGMQDFFKRLKVGKNGQEYYVMGRQPGLEETFLFFHPSGKVSYVDLIDLRKLYSQYRIAWPYEIFGRWERLQNRFNDARTAKALVTAGVAGRR